MRFEWDEEKAASNLRKHGVEFELAREVFQDPLAIFNHDRFVNDEARWSVLGIVGHHHLFVAFATYGEGDDEIVRIISARRANRQERRDFERGA